MKNKFLPFSTTLIGSMPRSSELLKLKEEHNTTEYENKLEQETKRVLEIFNESDIDIIVSGELSRDNYMSYIAEKVGGIKLMSMQEIKELLSCTKAFDESLDNMDAQDDTMNSPVCVEKIATDVSLNDKEIELIKKYSTKDFKITIPSPYLLTRSMWMKEITGKFYKNRKELGKDIVELLLNEVRRLVHSGATVIQIDEPILSEVVFTSESADPSFYWGALSEKVKIDRELNFAGELLKPILEEIRKYDNVMSAIHVCRGNWTCDESVLLEGAYDQMCQFFDTLDVDMLALEFSTPRAGEVEQLFKNNRLSRKIILGFGCINPRSNIVETPEQIVSAVEKVLQFLPPERIWLNPDCGFATFAKRPLNPYPIIEKKLKNMSQAAKILREKYC